MRAKDWSDALLAEHRAYLQAENGRQAFDQMVAIAGKLKGYECAPGWHGQIRDFRYVDPTSGERPYAFIVNREDLLFYVREAGFVRVPGGLPALKGQFSVRENASGEWTVRVTTAPEALKLSGLLFGPETVSVDPRSAQRLPADQLRKVTPMDLWSAREELLENRSYAPFDDSDEYDVLLEGGQRLPPKALLGKALSKTLGFQVGPRHFAGGESSTCFSILREQGYRIVPKGAPPPEFRFAADEQEWPEGDKKEGPLAPVIRTPNGAGGCQTPRIHRQARQTILRAMWLRPIGDV
jgi:hypothetical protein